MTPTSFKCGLPATWLSAAAGIAISTLVLSGCERSLTESNPSSETLGADSHGVAPTHHSRGADRIDTGINETLGYTSVNELREQLASGALSAEELVLGLLARIEALDRQGPILRSVIALNPNALQQAQASDQRRFRGEILGPLDGIPVLVKDNIETADPMATTAGSSALVNNITGRDNPAVANLRAAGAIILGKTNLSQWANFRSNDSVSGWSAVGGQVKNPHVLDRSPCGSSSGSGAAVAAGLAPLAIGTETNGSIICPSNVNGIVGFKPTLGLLSGDYIVPIAPTQDTAGPMARSVVDTALLLDGLTGGEHGFADQLSDASLKGMRLGVLRYSQSTSPHVRQRFNEALAKLEASGAELVEIESFAAPDPEARGLSLSVLEWEFKASLNAYLQNSPAEIPVRSLEELITWNEQHAEQELAIFDQSLFASSQARTGLDDPDYQAAEDRLKAHAGRDGIDRLLADYGVALLVAPSGPVAPAIDLVNGDVWPQWAGAGYLAAVAGYPHLTVPMGTARAVPLGLSFMGTAGDDGNVLAAGYVFEQAHGPGPRPQFLPTASVEPTLMDAVRGLVAD